MCSSKEDISDFLVVRREQVTSTMEEALKLLDDVNTSRPGVVLATRQTAGKGRRGNTWVSGSPEFYATFVFEVLDRECLSDISSFSLVTGLVLIRVLEKLTDKAIWGLKWPNDVLCLQNNRKVSGILLEMRQHESRNFLLIGIGVNLHSAPKEIPGAGSVAGESGIHIEREVLLKVLCSELGQCFFTFMTSGFEHYLPSVNAKLVFVEEDVVLESGNGCIVGNLKGVGRNGQVKIKVQDQLEEVYSGSLSRLSDYRGELGKC